MLPLKHKNLGRFTHVISSNFNYVEASCSMKQAHQYEAIPHVISTIFTTPLQPSFFPVCDCTVKMISNTPRVGRSHGATSPPYSCGFHWLLQHLWHMWIKPDSYMKWQQLCMKAHICADSLNHQKKRVRSNSLSLSVCKLLLQRWVGHATFIRGQSDSKEPEGKDFTFSEPCNF